MGTRKPTKKPLIIEGLKAERAGFEYHPLNGDARTYKNAPVKGAFLLAERAGFEPANLVGYTLSKRAR
jgi:hypothetical protein